MARVNKRGMVYFVAEPSGLLVKIGFTTKFNRRMPQLSRECGKRVRPLVWFYGTMRDEKALHAALWHSRVQGEWFWASRVRFVIAAIWNGGAI